MTAQQESLDQIATRLAEKLQPTYDKKLAEEFKKTFEKQCAAAVSSAKTECIQIINGINGTLDQIITPNVASPLLEPSCSIENFYKEILDLAVKKRQDEPSNYVKLTSIIERVGKQQLLHTSDTIKSKVTEEIREKVLKKVVTNLAITTLRVKESLDPFPYLAAIKSKINQIFKIRPKDASPSTNVTQNFKKNLQEIKSPTHQPPSQHSSSKTTDIVEMTSLKLK